MSRNEIRVLKRTIRTSLCADATEASINAARASALALLDRSVRHGHDRLAIRRLAAAIQAGAQVSIAQCNYCCRVILEFNDRALRQWAIETILAAKNSARPVNPSLWQRESEAMSRDETWLQQGG